MVLMKCASWIWHPLTILVFTNLYNDGCKMEIFQFSISSHIPVCSWLSTISKSPPFSPTYLFMYLFLVCLHDFFKINLLQLLNYLGAQIVPSVISGSPVKLAPGSFSHAPSLFFFFEYFLTFWYNKVFQAHLGLSCPRPGISHFSKEPRFLWLKNDAQKPR